MMDLYVLLLCTLQLLKHAGGDSDVQACGGKAADIMFVLDTSGSISYEDFRKEINFTRGVISIFDVSAERTHVGVISFSTKVIEEMGLGEIKNKDEVLERLTSSNIRYQGGGTHTGDALHSLWTDVFIPGVMRPEVSHIAIVLTDGMSYDMAKTKAEAMEVKGRGITVFVIGIGSNMSVDTQELTDIASEPTKNYMFQIANFDVLNSIKSELAFKACKQPPVTTPAPPVMNDNGDIVCVPKAALNLVFGFDITAIGTENAKFILQFIHTMFAELPKMSKRMTVSVISGGECDVQNGRGDALIDNAHSTDEIDHGLKSLSTKASNSIMKKMRLKFDRRARNKVGFLFLDKTLRNLELSQAEKEQKYAAFKKIDLYVIGVGDRVNKTQAESLTTGGHNYFHVDRYESINDVRGKVLCAIS
ncbi:collagen alpha-1(VII) chain-like [Mizuhopecten yessoensis]|uniref:collagen alpha-1(VII) chain-like n=1 Tax=Mizuhopecten yessoensis TaxID=6573 RepID=UPI000B45DA99|nr:collagen alpha-1(VII) chain-like [Mizuhopecten yessoensis]